ncbi:MAG: 2-C-methyl-D-erythritol 4-phosphate cytidylyltransferase [Spirochaetales bacterium]|nr:2-C-methyl-D-erythritol 4-phosphate cytidylyltransferase [Spirochaetales bacterium]
MTSAAAIITAAGTSSRMNMNKKKQYLLIGGVPAFCKAVRSFLSTKRFQHVVITVPKGDIEYATKLAQSYFKPSDISILTLIEGGSTRQESVYLALEALSPFAPEIVLVHDGARPWITEALINKITDSTLVHGACIPVIDIPDAVKKINGTGFIEQHVDKNRIKGAQTPQGFLFSEIIKAHRLARNTDAVYLDDAKLYTLLKQKVYTVPGDPANRKLTYKFEVKEK